MNCYIVVVNYRRWEDTVECVRSVFASDHPHIKVLVVDNCSGNQSLENIRKTFSASPLYKATDGSSVESLIVQAPQLDTFDFAGLPDLLLVQSLQNKGFASGNNLVLQYLKELEGHIFLLNPDMTVHKSAISALTAKATHNQNVIVGLVTKSDIDKERILFYGGGRVNKFTATVRLLQHWDKESRLDYISGGALFANTRAFRDIGLLPEQYFLYWEETDWCRQAVDKGFRLDVCTEAICYDKISTVIGRGFQSDYYYSRNGLMFLKKYARWGLPSAILAAFARVFKRLIQRQWSRARGIINGVVDFLTGSDHGH